MESDGADSAQEQPFSTTSDAGGLFLAPGAESVADFGTGAAANLVCFSLFEHRSRIVARKGYQKTSACPSSAISCSGNRRPGDARHAADIPEALGGRLDFLHDLFRVSIALRVNHVGHYVLRAVEEE